MTDYGACGLKPDSAAGPHRHWTRPWHAWMGWADEQPSDPAQPLIAVRNVATSTHKEPVYQLHFRPHRLRILRMSHVAWSVCLSVRVSVFGSRVRCTKTAEPIEMSFGGDSGESKEPCIRWVVQMPHGKGHFLGEDYSAGHCNVHTHECIAHCSFAAAGECACPAHAVHGRMHSLPREATRRRCGLLPNHFGHLYSIIAL